MTQTWLRQGGATGGLLLTLIASVVAAPIAAAAPESVAAASQCTRLGPDSAVTVTGSYRVKNPDCNPGPWQAAPTPRELNLTDGDYVETQGSGGSCAEGNARAQIKPGGNAYCGPAWETRNDPIPGFN